MFEDNRIMPQSYLYEWSTAIETDYVWLADWLDVPVTALTMADSEPLVFMAVVS